ncbi:MAG TPA: NAD(P)/FAD-dependent oxidoreductase [Candidatus Binatia bacterium]|nr:NAD(P)/FAD-dependent oxidoreductase [Candidatus Binatia bacterium]
MVLTKPDFDVAIIGGGPAGSSMGAYLAKAGVNCVVFERELFPRPHVGESLVPSSTRVFKDLDFLPQMEMAKFPKKYGAVWTTDDKKTPYVHDLEGLAPDCNVDIRFDERQQTGVDKNHTYHVDRGKFDLLLLQHANKLGASVYDGIKVSAVDFGPKEPIVRFNMGPKEMSVSARMVVDASGRNTFLGNQLKLKVADTVFDQYAIHSWFDGYDRKAFAKRDTNLDYIYIHFLPISNTWIWQIPISDTVTSLGVVTQKKNFAKSKADREKFFWESVGTRPLIEETLRKSNRIRPFKDEGDYSYAMKQLCGDRFVMVGDAGRFVDPIFSTGVSIALNSSRFAHKDILGALEKNDFSRESFSTFENTLRLGTKNWYDFITVYYRLNVLFTYFINDKRYRLDVLKLLQGDVYDDARPPVLEKMKAMVAEVEQNEKHPWHKLLGDLTSNAFRPDF